MLRTTVKLFGATVAALALSGCLEDSPSAVNYPAPGAPGNEPEAQARTACVRDVKATTGNPDVSVISSEFSQAGTRVILRVGPTGTWQCDAYLDGTTANIMSLTNEGAA
ncbi:MAG: hypothetical protein WBB85_03355 [Albidovulum sp.]|uniref:hypothetical protein n=1 Tax=Albidovulum sp. TaxID=1872424 RepID=UPI003CC1FCB4